MTGPALHRLSLCAKTLYSDYACVNNLVNTYTLTPLI